MAESLPILYSFRRCPYAIRSRLALAVAGLQPERNLELREVSLKAKPPEMLQVSAKGTVPVLVLPPGGSGREPVVLDESLLIMHWALAQHDPDGWLQGWTTQQQQVIQALIAENDGPFKDHLDRYKYATRFGMEGIAQKSQHREAALEILRQWNRRLQKGGWLLGDGASLADWALLPFVRQFRLADPLWFDAEPGLVPLQAWLQQYAASEALSIVSAAPWAQRSPWQSSQGLEPC